MFFTRAKGEQYRVEGYLRRICDLTSPNLPRVEDGRGRDRSNRTLPVLIAPWEQGQPSVSEAVTALTKDISDGGISVTLYQPLRVEEVVVGFWLPEVQIDEPWFFRAFVRQTAPLGGGFWGVGLEVIERLTLKSGSELARLLSLAAQLIPPSGLETSRPSDLLASSAR